MFRIRFLSLTLLVLLIPGPPLASADSQNTAPPPVTVVSGAQRPASPAALPSEAVAKALNAVGGRPDISSPELFALPVPFDQQPTESVASVLPAANSSEQWIRLSVHVGKDTSPVDDPKYNLATFQAMIVSADAREMTVSAAQPRGIIRGFQIRYLRDDGTFVDGDLQPLGNIAPHQDLNQSGRTDFSKTQAIAKLLTDYGLSAKSIDIYRPLDSTLVVVATLDKPLILAGRLPELANLIASPADFEGYYLELRSTDGVLLAQVAGAFRAGMGMEYVRPDMIPVIGSSQPAPPLG